MKFKGCRVVGIVGGDKKVNYLKNEFCFDVGIDYKKDNFFEVLKEVVFNGIDVYFENVGGYIGDEVFKYFNIYVRIFVCGVILFYNYLEKDIGLCI